MKTVTRVLRDTITEDYRRLCNKLMLERAPLDIYITEAESSEVTSFGFPVNYPYAGYDQKVIHLPLDEIAIEHTGHTLDLFPAIPKHWDMRSSEWPEWRVNLWHEAIHQYEDRVLGAWTSGNEHGASWRRAVEDVAAKLCVSAEQLAKVVEGIIVPIVKAKSP